MARKKTQEEKEYGVLLANTRETLKTRAGKEVIWHALNLCNLYIPSFSGATGGTEYMEGRRGVGLDLLQLLEDADKTAYARLLLDKINPGEEDDRDNTSTTDSGTTSNTSNTDDGAHIDSDTGVATRG